MSETLPINRPVTPASLVDEVIDTLMRGEHALFADLAQSAWPPQTRLAALTGSLGCSQPSRRGRP